MAIHNVDSGMPFAMDNQRLLCIRADSPTWDRHDSWAGRSRRRDFGSRCTWCSGRTATADTAMPFAAVLAFHLPQSIAIMDFPIGPCCSSKRADDQPLYSRLRLRRNPDMDRDSGNPNTLARGRIHHRCDTRNHDIPPGWTDRRPFRPDSDTNSTRRRSHDNRHLARTDSVCKYCALVPCIPHTDPRYNHPDSDNAPDQSISRTRHQDHTVPAHTTAYP